MDTAGSVSSREIVYGIVDVQLFELRFLVGERLSRAFVGLVGRQPDLVTDGHLVVVERKNVADPLAGIDETVEFVIAQSHDGAEQSQTRVRFWSRNAPERRIGVELLHVEDAVLDVERRIDIVHFELRLRAV